MATNNLCFTFGPNDSYFCNAPKQWARRNLPEAVAALFTSPTPIRDVFNFVLGPGSSYYIGFVDHEGKVQSRNWGLPPMLEWWLGTDQNGYMKRDIRSIRITLGPNGSFFAMDKDTYRWQNLPEGLEDAIQNQLGPRGWTACPVQVALGVNGTYVWVDSNGGGAWDLGTDYPSLDKAIGQMVANKNATGTPGGPLASIKYLSMNPFSQPSYLLVFHHGGFDGDLPDHWIPNLQSCFRSIETDLIVAAPTPISPTPSTVPLQNAAHAYPASSFSPVAAGATGLAAGAAVGGVAAAAMYNPTTTSPTPSYHSATAVPQAAGAARPPAAPHAASAPTRRPVSMAAPAAATAAAAGATGVGGVAAVRPAAKPAARPAAKHRNSMAGLTNSLTKLAVGVTKAVLVNDNSGGGDSGSGWGDSGGGGFSD